MNKISQIISDKDIGKEEKEVFRIHWFMDQICRKPPHSALKVKRTPAQGNNREEAYRPVNQENKNS